MEQVTCKYIFSLTKYLQETLVFNDFHYNFVVSAISLSVLK